MLFRHDRENSASVQIQTFSSTCRDVRFSPKIAVSEGSGGASIANEIVCACGAAEIGPAARRNRPSPFAYIRP